VGLALLYSAPRSLYGNFYNPTTISQFENQRLSVTNTLKLIPVLQNWLKKMETDQNMKPDTTQSNQIIKRKKVQLFQIPENPAEDEVLRSLQEEDSTLHKESKQNDYLHFISPAKEELSESDKTFAKQFKERRMKLGLTQTDIGLTLGELYGNSYTKTTISNFEVMRLPASNMRKLRPILQKWLENAESDQTMKRKMTQSNQNMKRKKTQSKHPKEDEQVMIRNLREDVFPLQNGSSPNADEVFAFYTYHAISKFENLRLPVTNFRKLKPTLQMWLEKAESDQKMK